MLQFTVKHEQNIDCGGGYAKLFDCSLDQTDMHGDSPYLIMFGEYSDQFISKVGNLEHIEYILYVTHSNKEVLEGFINNS